MILVDKEGHSAQEVSSIEDSKVKKSCISK